MKRFFLVHIFLIFSLANYAGIIDADALIIRFFTWNIDDVPHLITCNNYESEIPFQEYKITDTSAIELLNNEIDYLQMTHEQDFLCRMQIAMCQERHCQQSNMFE